MLVGCKFVPKELPAGIVDVTDVDTVGVVKQVDFKHECVVHQFFFGLGADALLAVQAVVLVMYCCFNHAID